MAGHYPAAITSRVISASALMTGITEQRDRGAFMTINSSVRQISGGVAAFVAGRIVVQQPGGNPEHYHTVGLGVIVTLVDHNDADERMTDRRLSAGKGN